MDNRNQIREFLASRRAKITPEQAGLPTYGGNRRVAGLRREEVALLAGVSVDYYTRLERGNLGGVSEAVLDALARALQLDEAERGHLFDLARAATTTARSPRRRPPPQRVRPGIQRILEAMTDVPADLRNGRRDILAANRLGYALYSEIFVDPVRPANVARFVFLSPRARAFFPDWEDVANDLVASLRTAAGRNPHDRGLQDLVGELSTRSQEFRSRWAAHHVRLHQTGRKRLHHPVVGDLELTYEVLALPADPGLSLVVYGAEPGSASPRTASSSWPAGRRPSTSQRRSRLPTKHDRGGPRPEFRMDTLSSWNTHVIPLVIPPATTRPYMSALAGRPNRPKLQGRHSAALGGRLPAVL